METQRPTEEPQASAPSRAGSLALVGGWPCLDFTNTSSGRGGAQRREHLQGYGDLLAWSRHAGLLTDSDAARLATMATERPAAAAATLDRALALREAIYRICDSLSARAAAPAEALARLNTELAAAMARARLAPTADGFAWGWSGQDPALDQVLWPVARSAAELLVSPLLHRLRQCPGRHCGWLFVDATKNGRRRWCEMQVCGSRDKARRYHHRKRAAALSAC